MSEGTFSIRVVDEDGNGVEGVKVTCKYRGILHGMEEEYTDEDGWARFHVSYTMFSGSTVPINNIWIGDDQVLDEIKYMEDGDTLSYTI
jgi:hypothetical protein